MVMTVEDVNLIESANEVMTRFFPTSSEHEIASKSLFRQASIRSTRSRLLSQNNKPLETSISPDNSGEDDIFLINDNEDELNRKNLK